MEQKQKRIRRSISLSNMGKKLDGYFENVLNQSSSKKILTKSKSTVDINVNRLPKIQVSNAKTDQKKYSRQKSSEKNLFTKQQANIKKKVQSQIDKLKANAIRSSKLVITKKDKPQSQSSIESQNVLLKVVNIKKWQDIKAQIPSTGYKYIECHSYPKILNHETVTTLSKNGILITQCENQNFYKIQEYQRMLKNYQKLETILFFNKFYYFKIFRKWKLIAEQHQINIKIRLIEYQIQSIYRPVYFKFISLLNQVHAFKYTRGPSCPILLEQYANYLFDCSYEVILQIQCRIFIKCVEELFSPIQQRMQSYGNINRQRNVYHKNKSYDKISNKLSLDKQKSNKTFHILKSSQFYNEFSQYFKVLKKCVYMFEQSLYAWTYKIYNQIIAKLSGLLNDWWIQKQRFTSLLRQFLYRVNDKYFYYTISNSEVELKTIHYQCQLGPNKKIQFKININQILEIFVQYSDYLISNLQKSKMLQCFARYKYQNYQSLEKLKEKQTNIIQIQIMNAIIQTNDAYNYNQIQVHTDFRSNFQKHLSEIIEANLKEVQQIIDMYNQIIMELYTYISQSQQQISAATIFDSLENLRIRLRYFPQKINIGIISLDLTKVHEYLSIQTSFIQTKIYMNVPQDFKHLFEQIYFHLQGLYQKIKISVWNIDELIISYKAYQDYDQYKSNKLLQQIQKIRGYLDLINNKCPEFYNQSFLMYVHIKQLKDKLDIKNQIFMNKITLKLKQFRREIELLKDCIWNNLFNTQTNLITICRQKNDITVKLQHLIIEDTKLVAIKLSMDKLQIISKLLTQHFIEQDVTINLHSYIKMRNDLNHLIRVVNLLLQFQKHIYSLFKSSRHQFSPQPFLLLINDRINDIKQTKVILISYDSLLRQILLRYDHWRLFLATLNEILYLTVEQMSTITKIKLNIINLKSLKTIQDCYNNKVYQIYNQIHLIKQRKYRINHYLFLASQFDNIIKKLPYQLKIMTQSKSKKIKSRIDLIKSRKNLDLNIQQKQNHNKPQYEFQNYQLIQKQLEQLEKEFKNMSTSTYLAQYVEAIKQKQSLIAKILKLFYEIHQAQRQYLELIDINNQNYENDLIQRSNLIQIFKSQSRPQINVFFQNYTQQANQIKDFWVKLISNISKQSLEEMLRHHQQIIIQLNSFHARIRSAYQFFNKLINKRRKQVYLLNLVDDAMVLSILRNPMIYFNMFYPIRQIKQHKGLLTVTTIYEQKIEIVKSITQQDQILGIEHFQFKIVNQIRRLFVNKSKQYPIDNLLNYMQENLPLQLIYAIDQVYFNNQYINPSKQLSSIAKGLEGQIRVICKNTVKQSCSNQRINYSLLLFTQLIASRIQLRSRIEHNNQSESWIRNVMIMEISDNVLILRNFSTRLACSYTLIDHASLSYAYPFCEKAMIKICNIIKFQENLIVSQTEALSGLAAKTMSFFWKVGVNKSNIDQILFACSKLSMPFVVGILDNLTNSLKLIFDALNMLQKNISIKSDVVKNRRCLPTIFIYCPNSEISELSDSVKLRFRTISYTRPSVQVALCTKMLHYGYLIQKYTYNDMRFLLQSFLIIAEETYHIKISHSDLNLMCDKIIKKISNQCIQMDSSQIILQFCSFFQIFGVSNQNFRKYFIQSRTKSEFMKNSLYSVVETVVGSAGSNHAKINVEVNQVLKKQYEYLMAHFTLFKQGLLSLKYEQKWLDKLNELFELNFNNDNRVVFIIGPHQSGKTRLIKLLLEYFLSKFGMTISYLFCQIQSLNLICNPLTEKQPILQSFLIENDQHTYSWLIFDSFLTSKNYALLEYVYSMFQNNDQIHHIQFDESTSMSLSELYSYRQRFNQLNKILHNKNVYFELNSIAQISPSFLINVHKVILSPQLMSRQQIYNIIFENFLRQLLDRNQQIYLRINESLKQVYCFIAEVLDEILIQRAKLIQWLIIIDDKIVIQRTLIYFTSFFKSKGREKLYLLFQQSGSSTNFLKFIAFCLYNVFDNSVDKNSLNIIQKTVKNYCYKYNNEVVRDNFLTKICYFNQREISYLDFQKLKQKESLSEIKTINYYIIETREMSIIYKKYLKQLVDFGVSIMIVGAKESGKTSMIKQYVTFNYNGQIIIKGANMFTAITEINTKLALFQQGYCHHRITQLSQRLHLGLTKKADYLIYVEDLSLQETISPLEKYLKYIRQHGIFFQDSKIKRAPYESSILQRRCLNRQSYKQIWYMYVINFQTPRQYYESIFLVFIRHTLFKKIQSRKESLLHIDKIQKTSQRYLKIFKFCRQNFKKVKKTWTYEYGMRNLKSMLQNFFDYYDFGIVETDESFIKRLNSFVYNRICWRLQTQNQIQILSDKFNSFLQKVQSLQRINTNSYFLSANNFTKITIVKNFIKNVITTKQIIQFTQNFIYALNYSSCILINKSMITYNRAISNIIIQFTKLSVEDIIYTQKLTDFMGQVQKNIQSNHKKITYFYITLEQIINNPCLLQFINSYFKQKYQRNLLMPLKDKLDVKQKFIIEYSTSESFSISDYLKYNQLIDHSFVLFYRENKFQQLESYTQNLLDNIENIGQLDGNVKIAIRIYEDLKSFEPPQSISSYFFSTLNFSYFITHFAKLYVMIKRKLQNKKGALDLSLSQLSFMFKEYKQRKAEQKSYHMMKNQITLDINKGKEQLKGKYKDYKSKQNLRLKEIIFENDQQISKLTRQKQQMVSSQKIWRNIYNNAHSAISRTEFAELKYMFLSNYNIERQLFQAIAFVLGDETDLYSMKKCFTDIGVMSRIKEASIINLPIQTLKKLQSKLQSINRKQRVSCGKNILEWIKIGCKLGLHQISREQNLKDINQKIQRLQMLNKQIRQKNRVDIMQKQIASLQKLLTEKQSQLAFIIKRISAIQFELSGVEKQYMELINFESYCLQELEVIQQYQQKMANFCLIQSIQFNFNHLLSRQNSKKFSEFYKNKIKKYFHNQITKDNFQYFYLKKVFNNLQNDQNWVLQPKQYLSSSKKRLILQIDNFLRTTDLPVAIVDQRCILFHDTYKQNVLIIHYTSLASNNFDTKFQDYRLIIIEMDSWIFTLNQIENEYNGIGRYRIFKYKQIRLIFPPKVMLIFVFHTFSVDDQFHKKFKIINLDFSIQDYSEILLNLQIVKNNPKKKKQNLFSKKLQIEQSFMQIIKFLCNKSQNINLKSKDLLKQLILKINNFNQQLIQSKSYDYNENTNETSQEQLKYYRIIAKTIDLLLTYFPSKQQTSFYFRDMFCTILDYAQLQNVVNFQILINLAMELYIKNLKDKACFYFLYYVKIYAIEEGIATIIQSQNLSTVINKREQICEMLKSIDKEYVEQSFIKCLPYKNVELIKTYNNLSKSRQLKQQNILSSINSNDQLSTFNKLILKRALLPNQFEYQLRKIVIKFEQGVTIKNKMFLRRFVFKQKLFSVCDATYWLAKLKFNDEYQLIQLSDLQNFEFKHNKPLKTLTYIIFDDVENGAKRNKLIQLLTKINQMQISTIFFSNDFLYPQFVEYFKFIPFEHLLNIFQIKQISKVSRNKFSDTFDRINLYKQQIINYKSFHSKMAYTLLFEKAKQKLMNKQKQLTIEKIIMQFQWCFFMWQKYFEHQRPNLAIIVQKIHEKNYEDQIKSISYIKIQQKIENILAKLKINFIDQNDFFKFCNKLRSVAPKLQQNVALKPQVLKQLKSCVIEGQTKFKRNRIITYIQSLIQIENMHIGKIQITSQKILAKKLVIQNFDLDYFNKNLKKFLKWKKIQNHKDVININEVENQFFLYLLFENQIFFYCEMKHLNIDQFKEKGCFHEDNDSIKTIISKNDMRKSHSALKNQKRRFKSRRNGIADISVSLEKSIKGSHQDTSSNDMLSINSIERTVNRRVSINKNLLDIESKRYIEDSALNDFFKDNIYILNNKIVGLKKITLKEQKMLNYSVPVTNIFLLEGKFKIRVYDYIQSIYYQSKKKRESRFNSNFN